MDVVLYITTGSLIGAAIGFWVKSATTTYFVIGERRPAIAQHEEDDRDLLLVSFHEAGILLPEECASICMADDAGHLCECDKCAEEEKRHKDAERALLEWEPEPTPRVGGAVRIHGTRQQRLQQAFNLQTAAMHSEQLAAWVQVQAQQGRGQTRTLGEVSASLFGGALAGGAALGCAAPRTEVPNITHLLERGAVHADDPVGIAGLRMFGMLP